MNLDDLHDSDEGFEVYDDNKKIVEPKIKKDPLHKTYKETTIARLHRPQMEEDSKWDKYKI
jgi:hypothetical protein